MELMQLAPSGGQIWNQYASGKIGNQCKWRHLVDKFAVNSRSFTEINFRGKVMSQEANKLQMPFLANSIYSRDPISKMSINCRSPFWPIQSIVEPISNTSINDTVARFK